MKMGRFFFFNLKNFNRKGYREPNQLKKSGLMAKKVIVKKNRQFCRVCTWCCCYDPPVLLAGFEVSPAPVTFQPALEALTGAPAAGRSCPACTHCPKK